MAAIKQNDVKKLTKEQTIAKVEEFEKVLLELEGEGKHEKKRPVKKGIARLKTYITQLDIQEQVKKEKQS